VLHDVSCVLSLTAEAPSLDESLMHGLLGRSMRCSVVPCLVLTEPCGIYSFIRNKYRITMYKEKKEKKEKL